MLCKPDERELVGCLRTIEHRLIERERLQRLAGSVQHSRPRKCHAGVIARAFWEIIVKEKSSIDRDLRKHGRVEHGEARARSKRIIEEGIEIKSLLAKRQGRFLYNPMPCIPRIGRNEFEERGCRILIFRALEERPSTLETNGVRNEPRLFG